METENKELLKLEQQLSEVVASSQFLESEPGRLWVELATKRINMILADITSDKYRKDLTGYNNALADLKAYRQMVRVMQMGASPERRKRIEEQIELRK